MIDERDISREKQQFYQARARTAVENLRRRNFEAQYVASRGEALTTILDMIPQDVTVVRGDSITLDQVGVLPELKKRGQKLIDAFETDTEGNWAAEPEERLRMMREAFFADIFIAGANAVTLDGKLVNIDGRGNRVAPMIFGPRKVIIVAGANKIVRDVDEALERIHQFCAPLNAKRHSLKHHLSQLDDLPCVRTGRCIDCNHDWRICRYTVIIEGVWVRDKGRISVVLVGEELGI